MRIVILPGSDRNDRRAGLGPGTLLFTLFLVTLLSGAIGLSAYRINVFLSGDMDSVLDDVRIVQLRETLSENRWDLVERKEDLSSVRAEIQDHIDALSVRLGEMQAQMFRINALGQRLAEISGMDDGEFDFGTIPGTGGIAEFDAEGESYEYPEFLARLDDLQMRLQFDENRLAVMESMLTDKKVSNTMFPDAWPVKGGWMSSLFGYRSDPFSGKKAFHSGIDIAARRGSPIQAAAAGVVVQVGKRAGYGESVVLQHADGFTTRYAHADKILVDPGQKVEKGEPIALVGSTGRSTGPHLHFEVIQEGRRVDPKKFLQAAR
jgi:murein DD-endopeptidase MepM/ murein hydrolase activator NlpD